MPTNNARTNNARINAISSQINAMTSHLAPLQEELKALEQKIKNKGACTAFDLMECTDKKNCIFYSETEMCYEKDVMKMAKKRQKEIKEQLAKLKYLENL